MPPMPRSAARSADRSQRALAEVRRRFGALLPDPAGARFFEVDTPSDMWAWFPASARGAWLGYTAAPGRKLDGPRPLGAPDRIPDTPPGEDWGDPEGDEHWKDRPRSGAGHPRPIDGVWDFRAAFGLLYVVSPGHGALESGCLTQNTVEGVLGGAEADVSGFERWLGAESRRQAAASRRVVGLCGTDDLTDLRVDPEGVVLPPGLLDALLSDLDLFCAGRQWYARHRVAWRRGLLLYGPPGNGKTTVARALASRALDASGAAFAFTPGRHSDDDVRHVFRRASAAAPAVLLMEDVDALRESGITRAVFLGLLEDAQLAHGVFLVATTNYPEEVDPALAGRAGRFDRAVHLGNPDEALRRRFLEQRWAEGDCAGAVEAAAAATAGLSLAALNEVHYAAMMRLRAGQAVDAQALDSIASDLRRIEGAKASGNWGRGGLGFRAGADA